MITEKKKWITSCYITVCSVFLIFWLTKSYNYPLHDYANSYFAAHFLLEGQFDIKIFDPLTFNKMIFNEGYRDIFASYNPNPPFTAIFFTPFALLPVQASKIAFNTISCFLFIFSFARLAKHTQTSTALFLLVPIILFIPIRNEILFGQTYFLIFFLLSEGYIAYEANQKMLTGFLWALATLLKVFPAIVVIFLIAKKDWRGFAYFITIIFMLTIICMLFQGTNVWVMYLTEIVPRNTRGEINSAFITAYQSAHMFFKYAFLQNSDLNPNPFLLNSRNLFYGTEILFKAIVLSLCISMAKTNKNLFLYSSLILGSLLVSPYGSTYVNLLLLFVLIASYQSFKQNEKIFAVIIIFLIANLPIKIFEGLPVWLRFPRLGLYVILLLFLFYRSDNKFNWRALLTLTIIFLPNAMHAKNKTDTSILLFKENKENLIYNFDIKDGYLTYTFWTEKGGRTRTTNMRVHELSYEKIELRNNQIFLNGAKITNTSDRKLKPALIDHQQVIYLSDKDRGFGFYNLRMIQR